MAQLFDIKKITIGPRNLDAIVELAANAPVMTSEDLEGTTRVWQVMPALRDHVCLGDASGNFGEVMGDTELAHLLEHVTVELLARTDIAGDITCGQTAQVGERTYRITLACPDDVLVAAALSSAVWVMQWAFSGGGDPEPDADAIAAGLVGLVEEFNAPEGGWEEAPDGEEAEPAEDGADSEQTAGAAEPADDAAGEPSGEGFDGDLEEPELLSEDGAQEAAADDAEVAPAESYDDWAGSDMPQSQTVR